MKVDIIKSDIRKEKIKLRKSLPVRKARQLSMKICDNIRKSAEYKRSKIILIYNAFNGEADLSYFAEEAKRAGKQIAYPLCLQNHIITALVPNSEDDFITGKYKIIEPDIRNSKIIEPQQLDLVVCPVVAFDENCNRLGMGGGYYDRYIPKCEKACITGAAFEIQKVRNLPLESNDVPIDIIFTEARTYIRL